MLRTLFNKKIFLLLVFFCSVLHLKAVAGEIFVVQSAKFPVYNNALRGFETVVLQDVQARGRKSIQPHTITVRILSEESSPQDLQQEISRQHPDLITVIGSSSFSAVKEITDIPIIHLLVPNPDSLVAPQANVTGVNMNLTAEQQLGALMQKVPEVKRIGLIYDPDKTGALVKKAEEFARQRNIRILARPVKTSREVPSQLAGLEGTIDWYWMVPDQTVVTPETLDHLFLFSLESRIPVLTFAEKYLKLGAVLSVAFDAEDMGEQAGEMALSILDNARVPNLPPPVRVRNINISVNPIAAKTLGIVFSE